MDYQKIAGDVLFGADTLDNSMRGVFIEAVVFHALTTNDAAQGLGTRWRHVGLGWGPWDLLRGSAQSGDRVRVQVKAKAPKQLWTPQKEREPAYDLGLSTKDSLPSYFARDFPPEIFGECEASGYRTDLFLFAWHADGTQADPNNYDFYIVPAGKLAALATPPRRLTVNQLTAEYEAINFVELPANLNEATDVFLSSMPKGEELSC